MDITIGTGSVRATIQPLGAMTTIVFEAGTDKEFSPTYVAPWEAFPEIPLLNRLRGDFLCAPFGAAPASAEDLPTEWRGGFDGPSPFVHGPSGNLEWTVLRTKNDTALLALDYPSKSSIERVERTVTCVGGAVEFVDAIAMRHDARLPLGLHPILRLPDEVGAARIEVPDCASFWAFPADSGTSVLRAGAVFPDLAAAPRANGATINLTRVPLAEEVDEIVLIAGPKRPEVALVNEAEGYRVAVEWDQALLKNAMLWISNRGRKGAPWGGTNLCLGVEPITSAFDFGTGVSGASIPLAEAGFRTAVELKAGERYEIRHRITGEAITQGGAFGAPGTPG